MLLMSKEWEQVRVLSVKRVEWNKILHTAPTEAFQFEDTSSRMITFSDILLLNAKEMKLFSGWETGEKFCP